MDRKPFAGKVALVTGGSSGIGRAAAVALAREGAAVVVAARRATEGEETVRLVKEAGADGLFVPADVAKAADVANLVRRAVERFDRVDFAVNNAGVEEDPGPFTEKSEADYDKIIDTNVKGVWLSMKQEIPELLKRGGGAIVNVSSVAGVVGLAGVAVYVASKHAVIGLTKAAALEYARKGIRVNAVAPGPIDTAMFERFAGDKPRLREQIMAMNPIGRVGKPEEIADAVVWLCSDKSSYVTGHTLMLDGGIVAS